MTREQLVRVFPDGRTVHIPSDGRPLPGYALALADIRKHGSNPSEMSIDAARSAGIQVADAGVTQRSVNPFAKFFGLRRDDEDDDASAAAPAATTAAVPLRTRMVAAIERAEDKLAAEKTKLIQVASKAEEKLAAEKTKFVRVASKAHVISRAEASPLAAVTPNQIILARGFWQGVPDGMNAARPAAAANPLAAVPSPHRSEVASAAAAPDATGSVGPFANAAEDRVPAELALAYAEQADRDAAAYAASAAATTTAATPRAAVTRAVAVRTGDTAMTIAVKRVEGRPASAILTVANKTAAPLADGGRLDDPWLRAIVVAPSVNRFLCITALGAPDFRALAPLMVKPANSVMMTFAADPQPGLAQDHFAGSAIVFVSTVTYPLHTAALE
jgi:hypothetical protein